MGLHGFLIVLFNEVMKGSLVKPLHSCRITVSEESKEYFADGRLKKESFTAPDIDR
jgi:hypothetical protein